MVVHLMIILIVVVHPYQSALFGIAYIVSLHHEMPVLCISLAAIVLAIPASINGVILRSWDLELFFLFFFFRFFILYETVINKFGSLYREIIGYICVEWQSIFKTADSCLDT